MEPFLKEQPDNFALIGDLALTNMGLGEKTAALALAERAIAACPIEKNAMDGLRSNLDRHGSGRRKWQPVSAP